LAKTPRTWSGARTPSGLKRVRQATRRREVLAPRRSAAKTYVAKALTTAATADSEATTTALIDALSALDRAAKVGAIHPNAAARRKSRLTIKINAALGGTGVSSGGRVTKQTGRAAQAKAAKARIAAGKSAKAKYCERNSSPRCKEFLQNARALLGQDPPCDVYMMIELRMRQHLEAGAHRAALGIVRTVHHARHACLNDRTGAHGTRLERYIHGSCAKAVIAGGARSFTEDDNFRVRRGVAVANGAVACACKHFSIRHLHEHCANRDFARFSRQARLFQRKFHVLQICHRRFQWMHTIMRQE